MFSLNGSVLRETQAYFDTHFFGDGCVSNTGVSTGSIQQNRFFVQLSGFYGTSDDGISCACLNTSADLHPFHLSQQLNVAVLDQGGAEMMKRGVTYLVTKGNDLFE